MPPHAAGERVRVAHQRRAAMMVDDALRIAGRAGRVVQADRIPFVVGHAPGEIRIAFGDAAPRSRACRSRSPFGVGASAGYSGSSKSTTSGFAFARFSASRHDGGKFAVDDHHFRFRMVELEGDHRRVEPRVDRVQHGAEHRHAVMRLEHRRRVGEHHRDGVADADAAFRQAPRRAGARAHRNPRRRRAGAPCTIAT